MCDDPFTVPLAEESAEPNKRGGCCGCRANYISSIPCLRDGCTSVQSAVNQRSYDVLNGIIHRIIAYNAAVVATVADATACDGPFTDAVVAELEDSKSLLPAPAVGHDSESISYTSQHHKFLQFHINVILPSRSSERAFPKRVLH
jgi:hypothetical protein